MADHHTPDHPPSPQLADDLTAARDYANAGPALSRYPDRDTLRKAMRRGRRKVPLAPVEAPLPSEREEAMLDEILGLFARPAVEPTEADPRDFDVRNLAELRQQTGRTQVQVAEALGTTQSGVSRIERQDDIHVSTLTDYVAALGGRLRLIADLPGATQPGPWRASGGEFSATVVAGGRPAAPTRDEVREALRVALTDCIAEEGEAFTPTKAMFAAVRQFQQEGGQAGGFETLLASTVSAVVALLSRSAAEPPEIDEAWLRGELEDAMSDYLPDVVAYQWAEPVARELVHRLPHVFAGQLTASAIGDAIAEADRMTGAGITDEQVGMLAGAVAELLAAARGVAAEPNEETESDG